MSVKVVLPNAFQKHTNGTREIQSAAQNLPQLITEIETSFPALKPHLRDNDGKVRRFINFYVNEEDIRFLGDDNTPSKMAMKSWSSPPSPAGLGTDRPGTRASRPERGSFTAAVTSRCVRQLESRKYREASASQAQRQRDGALACIPTHDLDLSHFLPV